MTESMHEVFKRFRPNPPEEECSTTVDGDYKNVTSELMLKNFEFIKILNNDPKSKQICLECRYEDKSAILVLEKHQFDENLAEKIGHDFKNSVKKIKNLFRNDVYGSYLVNIDLNNDEDNSKLNKIHLKLIHPASGKDLEKYSDHPFSLFEETAALYLKITKPYIDQQLAKVDHLRWVYNILDGKAEKDRVIYSDEDFMMVKDMKWNCNNDNDELTDIEKSGLYINAIVYRRDIHSLRDLNENHLELLKSINQKGREAIWKKYCIPENQQRLFIHYRPSFYHLHVHFTHCRNESKGFQCERAHLLTTVIQNITMIPDYYQKVSLEYSLSDLSNPNFKNDDQEKKKKKERLGLDVKLIVTEL